jgi:Ca2+-transporting ATPase
MNEATVRAMVFSTFVFGNMFLILNTLSKTRSWWSVLKERNRAVVIIFTLAFVLLFMTLKVPFLQSIFSFEFPGYINLLKVFLSAFGMLLILELLKQLQVRHKYNKV